MRPSLRILLSTVLLSLPLTICAQNRLHLEMDLSSMYGIYETGGNTGAKGITHGDWNMWGYGLHMTAFYELTEECLLGAGVGGDMYYHPKYTTVPVYGAFQWHPEALGNFFLFTDLGYSFKSKDTEGGFMGNLGAGYQWKCARSFALNFKLGGNVKTFKDDWFNYGTRSSLMLQIGIIL